MSLYSLLCRYGIFSRAAINATIFTAFTHGMILVKSVIFSYAIIFISSRLMSHVSAQLSYPPTKLIESRLPKKTKCITILSPHRSRFVYTVCFMMIIIRTSSRYPLQNTGVFRSKDKLCRFCKSLI